MERQDTVYRRYPLSNDGLPARYARAIATYRHGDLRSAVAQIDALIQQQPSNPYFYELRGQALLEGGKPAEAIAPLRKAVQVSNNAPLIEMLLGQALVASIDHTGLYRGSDRDSARGGGTGDLGAARLYPARNGLRPQGRYAQADLASAQAALPRRCRPASRSAPPDGSRPTISLPQNRCPARRTIRNRPPDLGFFNFTSKKKIFMSSTWLSYIY